MHDIAAEAIKKWASSVNLTEESKIADIGSLNMNGTVKELLQLNNIVGFDIMPGDNVDVVLDPGIVPKEHRGIYDYVISTSAFPFCPYPDKFRKEIYDLLKPGGVFFLQLYGLKHQSTHTIPDNKHEFTDCFRLTPNAARKFFGEDFTILSCEEIEEDIFLTGEKTSSSISVFRTKIDVDKTVKEIQKVLDKGWIGSGPQTEKFEKRMSEYLGGCKPYVVGVNSCTSALHLAVRSLNLAPGRLVLTTPITFASTNHALLYENLVPVFYDVNPRTGVVDETKLKGIIEAVHRSHETIGAMMVVHIGGYSAEMEQINEICDLYGIPVIEDCAHAFGGSYNGEKIGSDTDNICTWSFHAVKNLPMGDGGAITTLNAALFDSLKKDRWMGIDKDTSSRNHSGHYAWDYAIDTVGFKYQMNDVLATIGLVGLDTIDEANARRKHIALRYMNEITAGCCMKPDYLPNRESSYHFLPLFFDNRDDVYSELVRRDIYCGMHYKRNDLYPMYASLTKYSSLNGADWYHKHELTLPIHLGLTDKEIDRIIKVVNSL